MAVPFFMSDTSTSPGKTSVAQAKSKLANNAKRAKRHPDAESAQRVAESRRELAAAKLERHIQAVVRESPPLTEEIRDRLATLLRGAS